MARLFIWYSISVRVCILFFLLFPSFALAQVYISEIAWMGDSESANNEWIELYAQESTNISGWSLSALDGTPSIALDGTIDGAFVLYRGTEYVGALENGGEVLILSNADGAEIDRADGSDGWSIGGDNESKETAQKVGGVWETRVATPGVIPVQEESVVAESSSVSSSSYEPPRMFIETPELIQVVAGDDHAFKVVAKNTHGATYMGALVFWNFGDGSTVQGNNIYHKYEFPGKYTAYIEVRYGSEVVSKKIEVVVREADISFVIANPHEARIENGDKEELDVSHWRIVDGVNVFSFPGHTYIAPENSISISSEIAGFLFSDFSSLTYPNGEEVTVLVEEDVPVEIVYVPVSVAEVVEEKEEVVEEVVSALPAAAVISQKEENSISIWVYAWVVLVLLVGGTIVYIRKYG